MPTSESSAELPDAEGVFTAVCAHTHLFPGSRCQVLGLPDPAGFAAAPAPVGLLLRFSDDVEAEAELLVSPDSGAVLVVSAHTTRAGTRIGEHSWLVRSLSATGDAVEMLVGSRADR
ncbi:hypothetical protein [Streptomyces sp. NPDC008150]|uniref:hypothetical protein n=1 Tax=Streptomyces sp. NPDC008150 TaxID=3364816 RepID=UPI0036EBC809